MRSADTSPEAHEVQLQVYRSMSPARRVATMVAMSEEMLAVTAAGIGTRHPDYDDDSEFGRRTRITILDVEVCVATAEDTVLAKLEWAAMGGPDRQVVDAATVLSIGGANLDQDYLDRWAAELAITDLLIKARG